MRTDRRTDMTKLNVPFRNLADASKTVYKAESISLSQNQKMHKIINKHKILYWSHRAFLQFTV
jgi:hypothetical protein